MGTAAVPLSRCEASAQHIIIRRRWPCDKYIVNIHKVMSQGMVMTKGSYAGDCPLDKTQDGCNEKQDYR